MHRHVHYTYAAYLCPSLGFVTRNGFEAGDKDSRYIVFDPELLAQKRAQYCRIPRSLGHHSVTRWWFQNTVMSENEKNKVYASENTGFLLLHMIARAVSFPFSEVICLTAFITLCTAQTKSHWARARSCPRMVRSRNPNPPLI